MLRQVDGSSGSQSKGCVLIFWSVLKFIILNVIMNGTACSMTSCLNSSGYLG